MSDARNPEDTYLYQLSTLPGLEWFKNVALVCSYQDQYAPFDSTRIQICKQALYEHNPGMEKDKSAAPGQTDLNNRGNQYIAMAQNLLKPLNTRLLYRLDVNFHIKDKNMDSWIGRTAHIQFLECHPLMKMLVYRYRDFFA